MVQNLRRNKYEQIALAAYVAWQQMVRDPFFVLLSRSTLLRFFVRFLE